MAIFLAAAAVVIGGCATTTTERLGLPPLETVDAVDLSRYVGGWYEIASYPQFFQRRCTGTTATYRLRDDGLIDVQNRCYRDSLDGRAVDARGRARVPDLAESAKLEVSFFGPFWGDYWVIDLGEEYEYAVVGNPSRDFLWILSRTPTMEESVYQGILLRLRANGYTLDELQKTTQPEDAPELGPPGGS
jgi:apolipoprotein D and lipocalin family protein